MQGDHVIGVIECGPKVEGSYEPTDQGLLSTLGRQAAMAIHNSLLSAELSDRLEELAASRARLVQAEEAGRRRLERDLHDGVQQELVGVLARLGLARNQLKRDPTWPKPRWSASSRMPSARWRTCRSWREESIRRSSPTAAWSRP